MNERLEDLMYRAGLTAQGCWDNMDQYDREAIERFANLIISESINVVNRRYMGDNNREDFEVRRCVEDLKNHFGVE
jgi:ABC-type branched-subunit amino acid transport system substrate-binding protein